MDTSKQLGEDRILSLLMRFSLPAIIAMLVNAIYSVIDRIFIGQIVGPEAFAGAFVTYPIVLMAIAVGSLPGFGGASLTSIRLGQKRSEEAKFILGSAMTLLIILSVVFAGVMLIFTEPIARAFGAEGKTWEYAVLYLRYLALGFPFQIIGIGLNNFIRAQGQPRVAMITMIIGAITNVILDAVFMYVLDMGIIGAALATVIAQFLSFILILGYFFSDRTMMKLSRSYMKPEACLVRQILALGFAQFSIQLLNSMITLIYNKTLNKYGGAIAISSYGIISSILTVILLPVFGLNQGAQPIIGYNYGAKNYDRVKKALYLAAAVATVFTSIGFIGSRFFTEPLVKLFTKDKALIEAASHGVKIYFMFFAIVGFQVVSSNYFQAKGYPIKAFLMSTLRQGFILIPGILILSSKYGLAGIWYAAPVSDFLASFITVILLIHDFRNMAEESSAAKEVR